MTILLEPPVAGSRTPKRVPPAIGLPKAGHPRLVEVPERRYLAIDGDAKPAAPEFQAAVGALYATAYTLHFLLRERGVEAPVGHLEGLWEPCAGSDGWPAWRAVDVPADAWRWTLVIGLPDEATDEDVASAMAIGRRKHPSLEMSRLAALMLCEGMVVEATHVGPYATEAATIAQMREVATAAGLRPHGAHHEVYLGDPKRAAPERLRTVLRQPLE